MLLHCCLQQHSTFYHTIAYSVIIYNTVAQNSPVSLWKCIDGGWENIFRSLLYSAVDTTLQSTDIHFAMLHNSVRHFYYITIGACMFQVGKFTYSLQIQILRNSHYEIQAFITGVVYHYQRRSYFRMNNSFAISSLTAVSRGGQYL